MENKHGKFLDQYFAETDRQRQLSMLKDYMLSLPADDLKQFMMEPIHFFEKALSSPDVSEQLKNKIDSNLSEMIFLLKGKAVA